MKFRKSSQFVATSGLVALVAMLAISATSASAAVVYYDFDVHPSVDTVPMTGYAQGALWDGSTTGETPYGDDCVATGLQGDGTAVFADCGSESNNSGFVTASPIAGDFTVDMRIKVLENVTNTLGKSISIRQATSGNGRGLAFNTGNINVTNGGGSVAVFSHANLDLTNYEIVRFSVQSGGTNLITGYVWNGSGWDLLGSVTMGGTGAAGEVPTGGIGLGSLAGSSTTTGKFQIDWAGLNDTTALATTGSPLEPPHVPGPASPSCVAEVIPVGTQTRSGYEFGASNAPFASVDMGTSDLSDGLTHVSGGDGDSLPTTIGGRNCRQNFDNPNPGDDSFMYFDIADNLAFNGSKPDVVITFDYFDNGTNGFGVDYHSTITNDWTGTGIQVTKTNTNTWKTGSITLANAQFSNDSNGHDFRIARGGGSDIFYIDTVSVTEPDSHVDYTVSNVGIDGTCQSNVCFGGPNSGGACVTDANCANSSFNWTASESTCDGTANDYAWVTLSSTSGSLAPDESDPVVATLDSTTLAAGTHTAYIKFTTDCPLPPTCFTEPFTYSGAACPGNFYSEPCLVGNGGWTSTTLHGEFSINGGNQLRLNGGGDSSTTHVATHAVTCSVNDGVVSVKAKVKLGGAANPDGTFWIFKAADASGNNLGLWQGTQTIAKGKNPTNAVQATADQAITSTYKELEMRLNIGCKTVSYYVDNVFKATYDMPAASGTLAKIEFERIAGAPTSATDYVFFDDASITALSSQIIRKIDFVVTGCQVSLLEPKVRTLLECTANATTTEDFIIKNTGSADWTGFGAVEDGVNADWLTLSFTSSPVARFGTATITGTIDWSQVPITFGGDVREARLSFSASCDGGTTSDFDELPGADNNIIIRDSGTQPTVKIVYNGDVTPSANDSAGTGYKFQLWEGTDQGTVVADAGVGQADDGFAYRIVDGGGAGIKTKWRSVTNADAVAMDIDGAAGATAVARVKVIAATGNSNGNLTIYHSSIAGNYHWGGPNNIAREVNRSSSATVAGDASYHIIRITTEDPLPGTPNTAIVKLYLDENPSPVLSLTNASESGDQGSPAMDAIGFGTGSSLDSQEIYFDWVSGTNAGAFAPGEEVACIGSLIPASNCNTPKVDIDGDDDVDMDDFAVFQTCYTGSLITPPPLSQECDCFDDDNDNDIDVSDFNAFVECETGASVPWVTSVNCPN